MDRSRSRYMNTRRPRGTIASAVASVGLECRTTSQSGQALLSYRFWISEADWRRDGRNKAAFPTRRRTLSVPFDIRQLRYAIAAADHGSFLSSGPRFRHRAIDVEPEHSKAGMGDRHGHFRAFAHGRHGDNSRQHLSSRRQADGRRRRDGAYREDWTGDHTGEPARVTAALRKKLRNGDGTFARVGPWTTEHSPPRRRRDAPALDVAAGVFSLGAARPRGFG